jgi:hypothetical protein
MVRQAPPHEADGGTASDQLLDPRGAAANLTEELARLLAATIAQGQQGKRLPGVATGSELASLAALVSASQSQRAAQPSFRDGLSSLSYTPPPPTMASSPSLAPAQSLAPAPGGLLVSDHHDDEPMPIPSTWRQPVNSDDERWYRQQLGAAALGLLAGLIVVVPSVLWLSGWLGGPQTKTGRQVAEQGAAIKVADVKPVRVVPVERTENASQYTTAAIEPRPSAAKPPPPVEKAPVVIPPAAVMAPPKKAVEPPPRVVEPPRPRVEDLLAEAERNMKRGDIDAAREVLAAGENSGSGAITFALAETYDPNMLASLGAKGARSDADRARFLYTKALELGYGQAQRRLEMLRP